MKHNDITSRDIFKCQQCGDCCTGYGGTYITDQDIIKISEFINESAENFTEKYCQISAGKPVLKVAETGKCIFFDDKIQCTIHPVKPRMCRAWPFLGTILKAPGNWEIMSDACPGIKTGFSHSDIQKCVREEMETLNRLRKDLD